MNVLKKKVNVKQNNIDKCKQWIGVSKFNELILIRRRTSVIIIEYFPLVSDRNNPVTRIPVCLRPVLKRSKTNIELHVVKRVKLCAHATNTIDCNIFGHRFHFDVFLTFFDRSHLHDMSRIRFDPLSREFSNRRVFDDEAQRISVDGRPKRIEMYVAFSNENTLVLTRPKLNAQFRC